MTEFINWASLATYGGALVMVLLITQFTKEISFLNRIPTQFLSYIYALIILVVANAFTDGLTLNIIAQSIFNAIIVSVAANGSYSVVAKVTEDPSQL